MRLLMITGTFPPLQDGVGGYTETLVTALSRQPGVEVGVLTDRAVSVRGPGDPFRLFPVIDEWRAAEFSKVASVVREFRPDLVHIQYPTLTYRNWLPWLLPLRLQWLGLPVVQTWHERKVAHGWARVALAAARGGIIVVRPGYLAQLPWRRRAMLRHRQFEYIPNASTIPKAVFAPGEREALRASLAPREEALVVYFGFIFEHKGIDDLLEAMDFSRQHLVLVGPSLSSDRYQGELLERVAREPLAGHVTVLGYLPAEKVAQVLAVADAVALPFRLGGGIWNTSLHAAVTQGVFTLTTSHERRGYDPVQNVYYAQPRNVAEFREALGLYLGRRNPHPDPSGMPPTWEDVARRHLEFYQRYLPPPSGRSRPATAERASYSAR